MAQNEPQLKETPPGQSPNSPSLLFEYQCRSGKFIRLANRIESKLFFARIGMLYWTVQDGQAAISRCWLLRAMQQRLRMATRTQRAGRAAAAALTAPSSHDPLDYTMVVFQSAMESRCFWWLRQRMKFPRPQMVRSASAYWLAIRERRFSTKSRSMWKILARWNIRHHWVQSVPISCSLARNAPLRSFVVLCGPLRYLVIPRSKRLVSHQFWRSQDLMRPVWARIGRSRTYLFSRNSWNALLLVKWWSVCHYWPHACCILFIACTVLMATGLVSWKGQISTPHKFFFFSGVPHDGLWPCWWYVARACGRWPFPRLNGSQWWLTVHQYQSPSARLYEGVHKVSSNDWAVGATLHWPDDDFVEGPHVPHAQRSEAISFE